MMICMCLVLSLDATLIAGPAEQPTDTTTKEGPWALLFQVKNNFSLAPFQAGMLSVQRDLRGCAAVRFGAGVYGTSSDATGGSSTADETDVSFTGTYLRYVSGGQDVRVFLGAGPEVGFNRLSQLESGSMPGDTVITYYEYESKEHRWYMGCDVILGAEWRLTPHIAVTGEYSTSATYTSTELDKTNRRRVDDGQWETTWQSHPDKASWSFGDMEVKLGLTVYL
jgi:opacity protein-like surface antigen